MTSYYVTKISAVATSLLMLEIRLCYITTDVLEITSSERTAKKLRKCAN